MQITERQALIRDLIRDSAFLSVDELARRLDVAPQTIRRDVNALCDLGLARRRHGGVERALASGNLAYNARRTMNRAAKRAIATTVAKLIPNDASIAFGIGTTPAIVADALLKHERLRIYTNNLSAAQIATTGSDFEVHIAGGRIRNSDLDVTGSAAEAFFSAYKTDFGIFGVGGVDHDGCLLDFAEDEVRIRERIRENCRQAILVLDATKFDRAAHVRGGWIHEADTVVCDRAPPSSLIETLSAHERTLIVCEPGA